MTTPRDERLVKKTIPYVFRKELNNENGIVGNAEKNISVMGVHEGRAVRTRRLKLKQG